MNWFLTAALPLLFQAPPKASIEGVVLRAANGEPLPRTQVKLMRVLSNEERTQFGKFLDPSDLAPGRVRAAGFSQRDLREAAGQHRRPA